MKIQPTFLYIGTVKAGSTWLFKALKEHPEIYVPDAKDLKYFDVHYSRRSFEKYLGYFKGGIGKKAVGELSHDYFTRPLYAERIHCHLPDVKLICCLREPGDLAISSYKYIRMLRREANTTFADFLEGYFAEMRYADYLDNLRPFFNLFPSENILILFFDELKANPGKFIQRVYEFLGVDSCFIPTVVGQRVLPSSRARFGEGVTQVLYQIVQVMRRLGLENIAGKMKVSPVLNRILFAPDQGKIDIPVDVLHDLRMKHQTTYRELEKLINRPLPDAWYHYNSHEAQT